VLLWRSGNGEGHTPAKGRERFRVGEGKRISNAPTSDRRWLGAERGRPGSSCLSGVKLGVCSDCSKREGREVGGNLCVLGGDPQKKQGPQSVRRSSSRPFTDASNFLGRGEKKTTGGEKGRSEVPGRCGRDRGETRLALPGSKGKGLQEVPVGRPRGTPGACPAKACCVAGGETSWTWGPLFRLEKREGKDKGKGKNALNFCL